MCLKNYQFWLLDFWSSSFFKKKKMKVLFFLFFYSSALYSQTKDINQYVLNGKVDYKTDRHIYFVWYNAEEERFIDSTMVINGTFKYKGLAYGYLDRFYIKSDYRNLNNSDSLNNVNVPIENSVMHIELKTGAFSKYKLTGCKTCDLIKLRKKENEYFDRRSTFYHKKIDDSSLEKSIRDKYEMLDKKNWEKLERKNIVWCTKNPSNNLAPFLLYEWSDEINQETLIRTYNHLSYFQKNSFNGKKIKKVIDDNFFITHQKGTDAVDFEKNSYNDSMILLSDIYIENYVLIDFWASWCKPCRSSHPLLIKLFQKYSKNNFKIIGVADDDENIKEWKKAINQDSIDIWYNVLRGIKKQNNSTDLNEKYFIKYLPTKILINPKGKIIGRYVGDDFTELEKKLESIYNY
jgi:thiol-disulfide isomerase/thioredoxin